ncbi:hypothetical protein HK100_011097 [Physocladia obscura]|uniref:Uncharacterized protein n=1 Tax=Physocladia obscura TaxID=109957 RepID=A0AAD5T3M5_9FUNG|nr:hypothetical protein HK100_011097 [Physocladia obscura]
MFSTAAREISPSKSSKTSRAQQPSRVTTGSSVKNRDGSGAGDRNENRSLKLLKPSVSSSISSVTATGRKIAPAAENPKLCLSSASTKISNRDTPKAILDLGLGSHHETAFSAAYSKGGFPCRLEHGSVKHKISWTQPVTSLDYNPLLLTLIEGLRETKHPFLFLVPTALKEMILAPNAKQKILPFLPSIVPGLRHALASKHKQPVLSALSTTAYLASCTGNAMLSVLPALIPPIAKHVHASRDVTIRDAGMACLQGIESGIAFGVVGVHESECNGGVGVDVGGRIVAVGEWIGVGGGEKGVGGTDGVEALRMIRAKIPTYSSVFG